MLDVILDALLDTVKIIPFLFLTYIILEWLEHKSAAETERLVSKAGKFGPAIGAAVGVVPQCGFSASASNLYAQHIISAGTLLAVYLSTSDEMLPVFISESVPFSVIWKVLLAKVIAGVLVGYLIDRLFIKHHAETEHVDIHSMCEDEHCLCEERGILYSAIVHTLKIAAYILIVTCVLNLILLYIGEDNLANLILNKPVIGSFISSLIGLIPNCAASVVITELFVSGAMSTGAMLSGLLSSSGVGLLILFRTNRAHMKDNLKILAALYLSGVIIGILADLLKLSF